MTITVRFMNDVPLRIPNLDDTTGIVDALAKIDAMETHPKEEIIEFNIEEDDMKPINTRLYKVWQKLRKIEEVPKELLDELEEIADDMTKLDNSYLPDDLVDAIERYAIPQNLVGKRTSVLQDFKLDYKPDELPMLRLNYVIMNDDYKGLKLADELKQYAEEM